MEYVGVQYLPCQKPLYKQKVRNAFKLFGLYESRLFVVTSRLSFHLSCTKAQENTIVDWQSWSVLWQILEATIVTSGLQAIFSAFCVNGVKMHQAER